MHTDDAHLNPPHAHIAVCVLSSLFGHQPVGTTQKKLRETDALPRPVVLVEAEDAEELMGLVNKNEEAKVLIEILVEQSRWVSTHFRS